MSQYSQITFPLTRIVAPATQSGAQSAFDAGYDALNLPSLPVFSLVKSSRHLPAVFSIGQGTSSESVFPASTAIQRDDRRANAQGFAGQAMIGFGVVSRVSQKAINLQIRGGQNHRRPEKLHVVAGPNARQSRGDQMALGVADNRQLGKFSFAVSTVAVAAAAGVMRRTKSCFQSGRINGRLGIRLNQVLLTSICEDRAQQALKAPFFPRRFRAWKRVVGWGTFLSPKASRRSEKSDRITTIPRSSVLKNCCRARIASNWCWVKSLFENFDEYAGIALEVTSKAFLANATGDRVETRRFVVVSMRPIMHENHKKDFSRAESNSNGQMTKTG
jgi:hypothetical protein